jgi:hypothetical protein
MIFTTSPVDEGEYAPPATCESARTADPESITIEKSICRNITADWLAERQITGCL